MFETQSRDFVAAEPMQNDAFLGEPSQTQNISVLVVEDERADFLNIKRKLSQLERYTSQVHHAETVVATRRLVAQNEYDVIFVDFRLGDDSGGRLFKELRQRMPSTALILLTGLTDDFIKDSALNSGANYCLEKGELSAPLLQNTIQCALHTVGLETKLRNTMEQLENALSLRTDMLLKLSNDVRLPIESTISTIKSIQEKNPTGDRSELPFANEILENLNRATQAVNAASHYFSVTSFLDSGDEELHDITEIVTLAVDVTKRERIKKNIRTKFRRKVRNVSVLCNKLATTQAFVTLVDIFSRQCPDNTLLKFDLEFHGATVNVLITAEPNTDFGTSPQKGWIETLTTEMLMMNEIFQRQNATLTVTHGQNGEAKAVVNLRCAASSRAVAC